MERLSPLEVTLRPAAPRDADLLRQWRAEPSVRRFQPLNELPTAQLRADVASQRIADLYRGRGEKFQWIVQVDNQAGGWITLARLCRCQPFGTSGLDFVAVSLPEHSRWYLPWRYGRWRGTNHRITPAGEGSSPSIRHS